MKSLEMKVMELLVHTTKARLFSAIKQIGLAHSGVGSSAEELRRIDQLHDRLLRCLRAPFLVRHSLQDILDDIEDILPVDDELDISWILRDKHNIPDFVQFAIPTRLSITPA